MKLSIIIPCYNVEKHLDRCLLSVINQTYTNLEIILVDDGSPDNSGNICDKWAKQDKRIKVIHKQNEGLGFARNSGIEIATGEWIAFVDSDDFIDLSMYEKLLTKAIEKNADIVYCGHIKQLSNGTNITITDFADEKIFEKDVFLELSQGFFKPTTISPKMLTMSVWHAVYRRNIISQPFYSEREVGSEDIHFQVCAMLNARRVVFIPDALYTYCYNGVSLSHTFNLSKYDRYKTLNKVINKTYDAYGIKSPSDYCVFIMAFAMIRKITLSQLNSKIKHEYISKIVTDSFWKSDNINASQLKGAKKIFYAVLKLRSVILMQLLSNIYSFINYKIVKKGLE